MGTKTLVSRLVAKKEAINELKYYDKYHDIVEATILFLQRHNAHVMLYGGAAINSLLASPNKIYRDTELPDFDVFALDGEKMAEQLVEFMKARGYEYATKFPAMHAGTWKIIIDGMQIVDFSTLPRPLFVALRKGGKMGSIGVHTTNLEYLRHSLIRIMATPENTDRWKKVLMRLKLFNKSFPPADPRIQGDAAILDPEIAEALRHVTMFVKSRKYVRIGADAIRELQKEERRIPSSFLGPYSSILVNGNLEKAAHALCRHLEDHGIPAKTGVQIMAPYESGDVPTDHIMVEAAGVPIACLFANDLCWSYEVAPDGTRRGTLPTIISWLSRQTFLASDHFPVKHVKATYIELVNLLIRDRNINRHYTLQCYGKEAGLFTRKKEAFVNRKKAVK